MIIFRGKELLLNDNQGAFGQLVYNKTFKGESLTNDLYKLTGDDRIIDGLTCFKLAFVMGGVNKITTFEQFMKEIPLTYNVMDDYWEIIEKAIDAYLPTQSQDTKEEKVENAE